MPAPFIFDADIDGQKYHLPSPDKEPTVIILHDGTQAKLSHDNIVLGGKTISLSQLSDNQVTSIGSHKLQKQPGETKEPEHEDDDDHHGGGGGGGIGGFLGGLVGKAKKAGKGITGAGKSALNMAQGSLDLAKGTAGGVSFGTISGTLSGAGKDVSSLVASINGIQKSMPTSMITQAGLNTVEQAQNLGREASNWLTSTAGLVEGFKDLSEDVRSQVINNIKDFAGKAGTLAKAEAALKAFEEFPWEKEVPKSQAPSATKDPSASATDKPTESKEATTSRGSQTKSETSQEQTTTEPTSSATKTSSEASSSTSSQSQSATSMPTPHIIHSKHGTDLRKFKDFIQKLDKGAGELYSWESTKTQMYLTKLNASLARDLPSKYDFILLAQAEVDIDEEYDGNIEEFRAVTTQIRDEFAAIANPLRIGKWIGKGHEAINRGMVRIKPRGFETDENAGWWKKMISAKPPSEDHPLTDPSEYPPYKADDSGGRGTTIYVLDNGFDLDLPDLAADGRKVDSIFAPNKLTLASLDSSQHLPEGIGGGDHGTMLVLPDLPFQFNPV